MATHIWLRAEDKAGEERVALTIDAAKQLLAAGFEVTVEDSPLACIQSEEFAAIGCSTAAAGSWVDAPKDTIVLGLKELNEGSSPLVHRHIHFAHVYKNQTGWDAVLKRFADGDGALYDLEYLVNESGRRVAAFGYWAGYAGAALALRTWAGQQLGHAPPFAAVGSYSSKDELLNTVSVAIATAAKKPTVIVIGASGRSGRGAVELARSVGANVITWDSAETRAGGPFDEILAADIFVNCVFISRKIPPFVTPESLAKPGRRLRVICDVSCDPFGAYNPIPIYDTLTSFADPVVRLIDGDEPLDLISIDHLPSMLPREASEDFIEQLTPHLLQLDDTSQGVWGRAGEVFTQKLQEATS